MKVTRLLRKRREHSSVAMGTHGAKPSGSESEKRSRPNASLSACLPNGRIVDVPLVTGVVTFCPLGGPVDKWHTCPEPCPGTKPRHDRLTKSAVSVDIFGLNPEANPGRVIPHRQCQDEALPWMWRDLILGRH